MFNTVVLVWKCLDTPLASSVQESNVQDCGVGVEVSWHSTGFQCARVMFNTVVLLWKCLDTPLASSVQESDVQHCGIAVEVSWHSTGFQCARECSCCLCFRSSASQVNLVGPTTSCQSPNHDQLENFTVVGPSLWNSLPDALRRPDLTLLFHMWCAGKQKEHSSPPSAVVALSRSRRQTHNCRFTDFDRVPLSHLGDFRTIANNFSGII